MDRPQLQRFLALGGGHNPKFNPAVAQAFNFLNVHEVDNAVEAAPETVDAEVGVIQVLCIACLTCNAYSAVRTCLGGCQLSLAEHGNWSSHLHLLRSAVLLTPLCLPVPCKMPTETVKGLGLFPIW